MANIFSIGTPCCRLCTGVKTNPPPGENISIRSRTCSGAPALLRIANEAEDTETRACARACAREYLALLSDSALGEYSFYEFNLPRARAAKLLESIDK